MRVTGVSQMPPFERCLYAMLPTWPHGHAASYATLEAVIRHHLDPQMALRSLITAAILPLYNH